MLFSLFHLLWSLSSVTCLSPFFQLFTLLLDCSTFEFSYFPTATPYRWSVIYVMQSNCLGCHCLMGQEKMRKIIWRQLPESIYLALIIQGQFSGWQLFGGNYQWSIILWGNSLGSNFFGGNHPGGKYPGGNCPGGEIIWRPIEQGSIVLFLYTQGVTKK